MSPRAAWRLEAFGYSPVYDYVVGKADWLAAGLTTEGDRPHPPRVVSAMDRSVPTCTPQEQIADIAARLATSGSPVCVVVNDLRVVQGRLRRECIGPCNTGPAEGGMEPGPTTIRADADLAETLEGMITKRAASLIVTTPDGVLLGAFHNNAGSE